MFRNVLHCADIDLLDTPKGGRSDLAVVTVYRQSDPQKVLLTFKMDVKDCCTIDSEGQIIISDRSKDTDVLKRVGPRMYLDYLSADLNGDTIKTSWRYNKGW